jgi:transcriptional regulator with XRE-family HTH domain
MYSRLADLIIDRRTEQNLSRQALAHKSGVSYPYLSQIETGDRQPSLKTMAKLAQALELPLEMLASVSPQSWAGVSEESLPSLGTLAMSAQPASPEELLDPRLGRVVGSLRRKLRELSPLDRLEVLAELTREAVRDAKDGS